MAKICSKSASKDFHQWLILPSPDNNIYFVPNPHFPPPRRITVYYSEQSTTSTETRPKKACLITFHVGVEGGVCVGGLAFAFVMFLPEKTDEVIAERAALFTWHDKSMNHLFQHCSAVASGGMILSPNTHPCRESLTSVWLC